jgi:hypothetical protein
MFVAEEQCLTVGFAAAPARLANLLHGGALVTSSADCYEQGVTGLARAGPLGSAPGVGQVMGQRGGRGVGGALRVDATTSLPPVRSATAAS